MIDIFSVVFYFGIAIFAILFCRFSEKSGKPYGLFISILLLSLAAGLRDYSVGIDTSRYQLGIEYFYNYHKPFWEVSFSYGYGYFASFVLHIWNSFSFFLFVQALITNGLIIFRFWDFRQGASLSYMLFFYTCTMYLATLNIMCQYIAVAIVFFSTRYLDKGRYLLFLFGLLIATSIHNSAIVAVVLLFPYLIKLKGLTVERQIFRVLVSLLLLVGVIAAYRYLIERYASYLEVSSSFSMGSMFVVQGFVFLLAFLVVGYWSKQSRGYEFRNLVKNVAPFAPLFYCVYILSLIAAYIIEPAGRISYYFLPYGALCFGMIAYRSKKSKRCFLVSSVTVLWFIVHAVYTYFILDGGGIIPYKFIF